jgi:hypothetical protein
MNEEPILPANGDFATAYEALQGFWSAVMDKGVKVGLAA